LTEALAPGELPMPVEVNVHEAKSQLGKLLQRVMCGEEVVIERAGRPVARLVPFVAPPASRVPGRYTGQIEVAADFGAPLPEHLLQEFEGAGDAGAR
jgi:prevent-host-death family protein